MGEIFTAVCGQPDGILIARSPCTVGGPRELVNSPTPRLTGIGWLLGARERAAELSAESPVRRANATTLQPAKLLANLCCTAVRCGYHSTNGVAHAGSRSQSRLTGGAAPLPIFSLAVWWGSSPMGAVAAVPLRNFRLPSILGTNC